MNKQTRLILTGGFLGAGKTSLIWDVAQRLMSAGKRVGLITNDQAPELVDSRLLEQAGLKVSEVSGSCFCCNFNGFTDAIRSVRQEAMADVILAEPVGSCADLSATIMQPLKKYWNTELLLSPLTVLADPSRLAPILGGGDGSLHEDAAYIFCKQLEESDIILITKTDTLTDDELKDLVARTEDKYPSSKVMTCSVQSGAGIDEWISEVSSRTDAGTKLLDIDYDRYAHGEAVLGWLNGTVMLHGSAVCWDQVLKDLMNGLLSRLLNEGLRIGHVKVIAENGRQYAVGNIAGAGSLLTIRGSAGVSDDARLIINARVECSPEHLDQLVREQLTAVVSSRLSEEVLAWRFLQPGRPNPTHRFAEVM
ncbi:MAG: cobalamin synthesis protein P47K [Bacteroidaceae bacterium]|nr:cobalamin synthesis protein P47K [Bacteroidaceae bacterium]